MSKPPASRALFWKRVRKGYPYSLERFACKKFEKLICSSANKINILKATFGGLIRTFLQTIRFHIYRNVCLVRILSSKFHAKLPRTSANLNNVYGSFLPLVKLKAYRRISKLSKLIFFAFSGNNKRIWINHHYSISIESALLSIASDEKEFTCESTSSAVF